MDSFSQDMEELLYKYARRNRGCFLGNPYGDFPQCQMVLECNDSIMVVSPVGLVRSRNRRGRVVSNYMAQTPVKFPSPFHLEIKPKNPVLPAKPSSGIQWKQRGRECFSLFKKDQVNKALEGLCLELIFMKDHVIHTA